MGFYHAFPSVHDYRVQVPDVKAPATMVQVPFAVGEGFFHASVPEAEERLAKGDKEVVCKMAWRFKAKLHPKP